MDRFHPAMTFYRINDLVDQINASFSSMLSALGFAGQVRFKGHTDVKGYGIHILVMVRQRI